MIKSNPNGWYWIISMNDKFFRIKHGDGTKLSNDKGELVKNFKHGKLYLHKVK